MGRRGRRDCWWLMLKSRLCQIPCYIQFQCRSFPPTLHHVQTSPSLLSPAIKKSYFVNTDSAVPGLSLAHSSNLVPGSLFSRLFCLSPRQAPSAAVMRTTKQDVRTVRRRCASVGLSARYSLSLSLLLVSSVAYLHRLCIEPL